MSLKGYPSGCSKSLWGPWEVCTEVGCSPARKSRYLEKGPGFRVFVVDLQSYQGRSLHSATMPGLSVVWVVPTCPTMGMWAIIASKTEDEMNNFVVADARSRVVVAGHANEQFLIEELWDGSIRLEPARIVSDAQFEYDNTPELRELLSRAKNSGRVTTRRSRV